jgi:hypothetical protein
MSTLTKDEKWLLDSLQNRLQKLEARVKELEETTLRASFGNSEEEKCQTPTL